MFINMYDNLVDMYDVLLNRNKKNKKMQDFQKLNNICSTTLKGVAKKNSFLKICYFGLYSNK